MKLAVSCAGANNQIVNNVPYPIAEYFPAGQPSGSSPLKIRFRRLLMSKSNFVSSVSEYSGIKRTIQVFVDVTKKLPEMVFRQSYKHFYFMEFDALIYKGAWNYINPLMRSCAERSILFFAPDMENFYVNYGNYPAFISDIEDGESDYLAQIHYDPNPAGMSIGVLSNIVVVTGASNKWMLFGDREFEIAVVGTNKIIDEFEEKIIAKQGVFDINGALRIASQGYPNKTLPERISSDFRRNYKGNPSPA